VKNLFSGQEKVVYNDYLLGFADKAHEITVDSSLKSAAASKWVETEIKSGNKDLFADLNGRLGEKGISKELMNTDHHKWKKGLSEIQKKDVLDFYEKRYGQ